MADPRKLLQVTGERRDQDGRKHRRDWPAMKAATSIGLADRKAAQRLAGHAAIVARDWAPGGKPGREELVTPARSGSRRTSTPVTWGDRDGRESAGDGVDRTGRARTRARPRLRWQQSQAPDRGRPGSFAICAVCPKSRPARNAAALGSHARGVEARAHRPLVQHVSHGTPGPAGRRRAAGCHDRAVGDVQHLRDAVVCV